MDTPILFPSIFIGHGNPMYAITPNAYTAAWSNIGKTLRRPKAILSISAHWYVEGAAVTIQTNPRTIHDFGGFPPELYQVNYPASGDPALAKRVQSLLAPLPVAFDDTWGLDHGTWSVLRHVYPEADIPVVQLSIDETQPAQFHFDIGQRLAPLRRDGVLIVGSGNLVHNLHAAAWGQRNPEPYDWAIRFDALTREAVTKNQPSPLIHYESLGRDAQLSVPTPDHFLPLLYVLGTRQSSDAVTFPVEGIDMGSISMLTIQLG